MHQPSRRAVLGAGIGSLALAIVGMNEAAADAATVSGPMRRDYAASVGKVFTVQHNGRTHRLTLTAVHDLPHTSVADRQYCFSLLFTPGGTAVLRDGIYTVQRTGVPTHSLFLARVGTGRALQAVVNRAH